MLRMGDKFRFFDFVTMNRYHDVFSTCESRRNPQEQRLYGQAAGVGLRLQMFKKSRFYQRLFLFLDAWWLYAAS